MSLPLAATTVTPCKAMVGQVPARGSLSTPKQQSTRRNSDSSTGSGGAPKKDMSAVKGSPALFKGIALSSSFEGTLAANAKRVKGGPSTAWGGGEINKRPLIIPLIYGSNGNSSSTVSIHSPDPCSKFHHTHSKDHGKGSVAVSPMSPPAGGSATASGNELMTPLAQTPKGTGSFHDAVFSHQSDDDENCGFDDSFSSCHEFSPIGVDNKMKPSLPSNANGACPLIYGSNVTMDSPDPCSKYHTGRGPVAMVSPSTPLHAVHQSASLSVGNVLDDMASPDVLSKFHEERGSVKLAPALAASGRSSQGQAVADKAWRQLVLVQEKEESIVIEKEAWITSTSSNSSHKQQQTKDTQHRKASSRVSPVSVVEAFFNGTVSPMKPNYEAARMLIHNGVKLATATNSDSNKTPSSEERSSPLAAAAADVFSNTLSPFKPNYNLVRENINSKTAPQQQQQQPTYFYKQPVRPAAPPPRSQSESGASKSFPRRFGLSGNTSSNNIASQGQQKNVASPMPFSSSHDNNNNKENEDPNMKTNLRSSKSSSSIPSSSSLPSPSTIIGGNGSNVREASPERSTGGRAPFKRGRQFKEMKATPTTMTERSELMTELSRSGRVLYKEPLLVQSNGRWQSPQRAARRIRVSHLECKFHANQHGSNKLPRKKRPKYERVLETLDERLEICLGYPSFIIFVAPSQQLAHRSVVFQDLSVVPRPMKHGQGQSEEQEEPDQDMEETNATSQLQLSSNDVLAGKLRPAGLGKRKGGGLAPLSLTTSTSTNTAEPEGSSCLVATLRDDTYGNWMKKQARTQSCCEENSLFALLADSNIEALKEKLSPLSDEELHEAINNTRDARGNTLLIFATCLGNRKLVKLLLLLGAGKEKRENEK